MFANLVVTIHVLTVFWMVAGVVGRAVSTAGAAAATDLAGLRAAAALGSRFEHLMVRPGSLAVLASGIVAAWLRGWPILGFLQGGASNWVLVSLALYLTIIPVIVFLFMPRGVVYRRALDEATATGSVTPALRAALADPVVAAARHYEVAMLVVITFLMVAKPF